MGLYSDSKYLIKEEIETVHKDHFLDFAVAGTWGNSEQRIAIASFAREAGISAGLLEETPNTFAQESNFKLSKVAKLVVEKLAISPKDILKDFFDEVINTGLSEEEYVAEAFKRISRYSSSIDIIVHSIAFANRDDLGGRFIDTQRDGFKVALDISAYSLVSIARHASTQMNKGGNIITMSFMAAEKVFPGYNVMSTAKAALENVVGQLANDLGPDDIRVNAISAGPLDTLSSRVISGYRDMKKAHAERSPMKRNITPSEVASTALYLCSDLSSGVTGEIIHVDTGYHVMGI